MYQPGWSASRQRVSAALRLLQYRKHPELVQQLQARAMALQGRGGDTEVAHVTVGEIVLPRALQTRAARILLLCSLNKRNESERDLSAEADHALWRQERGQVVFNWFAEGESRHPQLDDHQQDKGHSTHRHPR